MVPPWVPQGVPRGTPGKLGKLVRPPQRWRCMALRRRRLVRSGTLACAYCPTVIIAAAMVAAVRQPLAPLQYKMSRPSTLRGIGGPRARGGRQSGGLPGNEWMDDVAAAPPLVRSETCHVIVQLVRRIMKERTCCSAVLGQRGVGTSGYPGVPRGYLGVLNFRQMSLDQLISFTFQHFVVLPSCYFEFKLNDAFDVEPNI